MSEHIEWLNLIDRSGPFLEPEVLDAALPQGLERVDSARRRTLLSAYDEWREAVDQGDAALEGLHREWIHLVLNGFLDYEDRLLLGGTSLPAGLTVSVVEHNVAIQPRMALMKGEEPTLLIDVIAPDEDLEVVKSRDGWSVSALDRMVALCRGAKVPLGLVTNGERWLVVHVPEGGTVGHASWYGRIWRPEPVTLRAFQTLLGVRRCYGPHDKTLAALLTASLDYQEEVTNTLGQQVRRAVEVLIQSLDRANDDRHGELLKDVDPRELYEAGLTVMMRLVFLLCAEERGLLLLGEGIYDQNYAISTLRSELREWQSRYGDQLLERRHDAWSRLLATFRSVYGGITHETLRMPALGGSLFDPDRFPFLEGRPKGSSWRRGIATPLPIDNRTVLLLLSSLQVLELRKGARLLSYKALDVEQIGHVYEGLLECTVQRLHEITLGLEGASSAKDPNVSLVDLERSRQEGETSVLALLGEVTGRSESALRRAMGRELDEAFESQLLLACGSDPALLRRVKPWVNLLRKDIWDQPLIYRKDAFAVAIGNDRRETGTHYTPKSLTERIVHTTLEPLVYAGPSDGKPREAWILTTPRALLELKICDPAMGSGAFLVQVCRYLGERLVECWAVEEGSGRAITVDGEVVDSLGSNEQMPSDLEERIILARRLVAERCLYGVDINPMAVELAKLSIWLVTLAKGRPFGFLDHNLKFGDSLLGIYRLDQLTQLRMTPGAHHPRLFGQRIEGAVTESINLRSELRNMPIRDVRDVEVMAVLDTSAQEKVRFGRDLADIFIGIVFGTDNQSAQGNRFDALAHNADALVEGDSGQLAGLLERAKRDLATDARDGLSRRPFHWPLEFPEVFSRENSGFDAMVGNPPFIAGKRLTTRLGGSYTFGIKKIVSNTKGAADLSAYFYLICSRLTRRSGSFGLIATNSISQGDTREVGLGQIESNGWKIIRAWPDFTWPGGAAVTVSPCILYQGDWSGEIRLADKIVTAISSYLEEDDNGGQPHQIKNNDGIASIGTGINGEGFILSPEEMAEMLASNPRNEQVIRPYLTSQDINQTPNSSPSRFAIDYWDMPEALAQTYEEPFSRLTKLVKPQRDKLTRQIHESDFWKHWDRRESFYGRMRDLPRVIVTGRVSKHHVFAFADPEWLIADGVVIFLKSDFASYSVLQSVIHAEWVQRHKTTMRLDTTYSVSRCFLTFPWPETLGNELESVGRLYLETRDQIQAKMGVGLTSIYNKFHDETDGSTEIQKLRDVHSTLDTVVAASFGINIPLEHGFHGTKQGLRFTISPNVRKVVIGQLLALNRQAYEQEIAQGLHADVISRTSSRMARTVRHSSIASAHPPLDFGAVGATPVTIATPARRISDYLRSHAGWYAKAEIIAATGLTDSLWNAAITELVATGLVERQGERRGARYSAKSVAGGA